VEIVLNQLTIYWDNIKMNRMKNVLAIILLVMLVCPKGYAGKTPSIELKIEQLTSGTKHHFFGYIGQDIKTGKVFTVLYDIEKKKRVHEYKFDDTPIGNGGVAADGSAFLAINYGCLARLRLVTGYPEALDWPKSAIILHKHCISLQNPL
jgi:hypothetical protein